MHATLISAPELATLLQRGPAPLIFDCSFDLNDSAAGLIQYKQSHIPGAIYADLNHHLSSKDHPDGALAGRHPLPSPADFESWLQATGMSPGQQVVVYDRQGANYCGRVWWMLKWVGHEAVAVLDGGLQAWQAANQPTESGHDETQRAVASDPFRRQSSLVSSIETQAISSRLGAPDLTIIDARSAPRFRGEVEPIDPVAGHIPGALNRPFGLNLDEQGRFKPAAQLRQEFETLLAGRDPATVVHHCGSGVSALPNLLAMAIAGMGTTALYPGSWSAWCNTPGTPRVLP